MPRLAGLAGAGLAGAGLAGAGLAGAADLPVLVLEDFIFNHSIMANSEEVAELKELASSKLELGGRRATTWPCRL